MSLNMRRLIIFMICAAAFDLYPLIGAIPLQGQAIIFPDLPLAFSSESHLNLPSGHLTFCLPRIPSKPLSFLEPGAGKEAEESLPVPPIRPSDLPGHYGNPTMGIGQIDRLVNGRNRAGGAGAPSSLGGLPRADSPAPVHGPGPGCCGPAAGAAHQRRS